MAYNGQTSDAPNLSTRCVQVVARWFIVEQRSIVLTVARSSGFANFLGPAATFGIGFAWTQRAPQKGSQEIDIIGRIAAVDYGAKRIGLAITDAEQTLASPADVISSQGPRTDAGRVAAWAARNEAAAILVGLPLNMDGSEGPQAAAARRFAKRLAEVASIPVQTWDERLTTFQANDWLRDADLSAAKKRRLRDALAAVAILQGYLQRKDRQRPDGGA